jgi:hypothetical protein
MKNIAVVAALALAATTASIRVAAACGGDGGIPPGLLTSLAAPAPTTAVGVYPRIERSHGHTVLTLAYPELDGQGPTVYVDSFEVVRDRNLLRLERRLAHTHGYNLDVSIERVDATRWRVTGWSVRA